MLRCKQEQENNPSKELSKEISKWSNFQMARKIQLNSLYGAIGNQYFRHYLVDNAEAITRTGQIAIRWIERKLNEFLNRLLGTKKYDYVVAVDTDSVYLNLGPLVSYIQEKCPRCPTDKEGIVNLLDNFCEDQMIPIIDSCYEELSDYLHAYEESLVMKREAIAEKGIWTAKKRYILNVWDNEGVRYKEPKLKMMGIEAIKSSTPTPIRTYIEDCLKIFMSGTEDQMIEYIERKRKEFKSLPIYEIAFPRTANNISKFQNSTTLYKKSTPLQVRAAIMYNHMIRKNNLTHKYNTIQDGEKIRYVFLRTPNPIHENVIAFLNTFPREFNLEKYIDYDIIFQKGFIDPLQSIMDSVGWHTEKQVTLESFFS